MELTRKWAPGRGLCHYFLPCCTKKNGNSVLANTVFGKLFEHFSPLNLASVGLEWQHLNLYTDAYMDLCRNQDKYNYENTITTH